MRNHLVVVAWWPRRKWENESLFLEEEKNLRLAWVMDINPKDIPQDSYGPWWLLLSAAPTRYREQSPRDVVYLTWMPSLQQPRQTTQDALNTLRSSDLNLNLSTISRTNVMRDVQPTKSIILTPCCLFKHLQCRYILECEAQHELIQLINPNKLNLVYYLLPKRSQTYYSCFVCLQSGRKGGLQDSRS